jgi:hypothetical protein
MTDEQLPLPDSNWTPDDAQASSRRPFDKPPRHPSAFGERCYCGALFVPSLPEQDLCVACLLAIDAQQARATARERGPVT